MPRRVTLPGAAELFGVPAADDTAPAGETAETAGGPDTDESPRAPEESQPGQDEDHHPGRDEEQPDPDVEQPDQVQPAARSRKRRGGAGGSGRVKHEEKITVYISSDELLNLERSRLSLRADHGMAVDRGRLVREALALVLDDYAENGADSQLVGRLSQP